MSTVLAMEKESAASEDFIARRTESLDAHGISKLVKRSTEAIFGRTNAENIIEKANLGISLVSTANGELLGHMAFFDYPNLSSMDQARWEEWLYGTYDCPNAVPINTLFLHLFVAKEGFQQGASAEILRTTFMAVPLLQFVFLTVTSGTNLGPVLGAHFTQVTLREEEEGVSPTHHVYVTHRHQHFPMLHIREARVEDADDLMPIFRQHTGDMSKQYGEYFLAELIASQDDHHRTIVADVDGKAVGFISVTTEVDVDLLNTCYQLEPLHGLRHPTDADETLSVTTEGSSPAASTTLMSSSEKDMVTFKPDEPTLELRQSSPTQQKSSVSIGVQERSSASIAAQQKSSVSIGVQEKSSASIATQQKSSVSIGVQEKSSASIATQQKSSVSIGVQEKSSASIGVLGKSVSIVAQQQLTVSTAGTKSSTSSQVGLEGQTSTQVLSEQQSLAAMTDPKITQSTMLQSAVSMVSRASEREETTIPEEPDKTLEEKKKTKRRRQYVLRGSCSALAIQLFAIDERYEMRSIDFLPAVFQLFPDHDFCILTQPHSAPEFPLLSHFARVNPRVGSTVSQELFVFHKCALLHSFKVRPVQSSDLPAVEKLVGGLEGGEGVIADVKRYVETRRDPLGEGATPLSAVVAECAHQVVGVAIVRQEEDIGYIRSHYNIEDFVYYDYHRPEEHGRLHHCVLNPAFTPHTKHFIKELLRLSHKSCLYYSLHTSSHPPIHLKPHTVTSALGDMVPVRPRRQVSYNLEPLGINAPLREVLERKEPLALYHTNRKLTLEPKIPVNSRVVVVGASDTAIACLEKLIFSPHLCFNNLTLISPHGVPGSSTEEDSHHCLPHSCCYWPECYRLMGLNTWVNVVRGKMVAINRPEQCVVVEGNSGGRGRVYYDQLVLCTGTRFCLPREKEEEEGESSRVYAISSEHQAADMLAWVKTRLIPEGGHMVVYGSSLSAYSTANSLLSAGLPPDRLTLTLPHPPCCFNNPAVEEKVGMALQELGVTTLVGVQVEGWRCEDGEGVKEVELKGEAEESFTLECKALVFLHEQYRHVDQQAFKAMNDACLVFDQRLVIDADHHTNDPLIFAAGPLTKFSRKYRADQWSHTNFNAKEVGQKLASTLLSQLDPMADSTPPPPSDLLPSYTYPKTVFATLPGGLYYLHAEKPNCGESLQTLMEQPSYGRELVTDTDSSYFRLHVNQYNKIQTITILSKQPFEVTNYLCLYNMHEKYLNNLLVRYDDNLITDFFRVRDGLASLSHSLSSQTISHQKFDHVLTYCSYFCEPWTCAVFHDRFPDFMEEIREHLATPMEGETESFEERVQKLLEEDIEVSLVNHRARLATEFESSPVKKVIENRLFRFLQYNSYHLPMYAKPDMI